jgi:hypothetical protein
MDSHAYRQVAPMNQDFPVSKRRSRLPWVLLVLVVAVIACVTLYRQFRSPPTMANASQSVESNDRGVNARRLSPEEIRALASRSQGTSSQATARNMGEMLEKRKRMAAATQERIQKRNAAMAARFAAEKPDPAWANAHEKDLVSLQGSDPMRDAGAKATNLQADCRSTMCRVQADFPDAGAAANWLQLYMGGVGDSLPVATAHQIVNPDGSVRVEIYGMGRKR